MSQPRHHILCDTAIAAHASSAAPAWLFSSDGSRLLFANAAGAALLGTAPAVAVDATDIGTPVPSELAAQLSRSADSLPLDGPARLQRLRGLGAALGRPLTCSCKHITRASGAGSAILVVGLDAAGPKLPLAERARYLVESSGAAAAFAADGSLLHVIAQAAHRIGAASLSDVGEDLDMLRVGGGDDAVVLAFFQANSEPIKSAAGATAGQPGLLDLSPIAEAITAMTRVPPQRQGQSCGSHAGTASRSESESTQRRHPLRFVWQTDAENRFTIESDEFVARAGPRTANLLGRFWGEISAKLSLDPEGQVAHALVSRNTWSGIDVNWPTADGGSIAVTLSAIPAFDSDRMFRGYRGLGVERGGETRPDDPVRSMQPVEAEAVGQTEPERMIAAETAPATEPEAAANADEPPQAQADTAQPDDRIAEAAADAPPPRDQAPRVQVLQTENVVPFPTAYVDLKPEPKPLGLSSTERTAFRDLGSRLAARLKGADELARGLMEKVEPDDEPPHLRPPVPPLLAVPPARPELQAQALPGSLAETAEEVGQQCAVLDPLPLGILIYRGANLIYANPAFLAFAGHRSLSDFAASGGLDAMQVELERATDGESGQRLRIAATDREPATEGRLVTVSVAGEQARMLMLQPAAPATQQAGGAAAAGELAALLDIAGDGAVTLDRRGTITSANARAEILFGYETGALAGRPFGELFAPESERIAMSRLERLAGSLDATSDDDAREIIGRRRQGGLISLQLMLGRGDRAGTRFHALFRDLTRWKEAEKDMTLARQQAEKASAAKSDFLAKISHEMRTPLNAIIGFSEVMMEERFGPVGNERYRDYLKDINASGAHLVSLLNDLLDLSKIEAGKMELSFERVDLNEVTQQSVAIMQAEASRARVIMRTALSMNIPGIIADTRSVRQIVLNLLSNSIKFTDPGGQVIVSTAANERGDVMLRVRDTGIGMSEKDIETALQPFRQLATSSRTHPSGTGLGLPLTKAMVEANRARFCIKSAVNAGTLVEIVFPAGRVLPE